MKKFLFIAAVFASCQVIPDHDAELIADTIVKADTIVVDSILADSVSTDSIKAE